MICSRKIASPKMSWSPQPGNMLLYMAKENLQIWLRILWWGEYPWLSECAQWNHKNPYMERGEQKRKSWRRCSDESGGQNNLITAFKVEVLKCSEISHAPYFVTLLDCSPPGYSVHGLLQGRILELVAISSCRGSSQPRDWTCVSWLWRKTYSV